MAITELQIAECADDDELFKLLSAELQRRLPDGEGEDLDLFLRKIRAMPGGSADSDYEKAMMPLTQRMWDLCGTQNGHDNGLLRHWPRYARKYPRKVVQVMA